MAQIALAANIEHQQRLVDQIRELQKEEKALRADILNECFGTEVIGTVKTTVDNLIVTGEFGLTYKFNQTELDESIKMGSLSESLLNCIRVKYELDKKCYDQLSEEETEIINEFLTITPSLPALKVKAE